MPAGTDLLHYTSDSWIGIELDRIVQDDNSNWNKMGLKEGTPTAYRHPT